MESHPRSSDVKVHVDEVEGDCEWFVELLREGGDDLEREEPRPWELADEARNIPTNRMAKADLVGDDVEEPARVRVVVIHFDARQAGVFLGGDEPDAGTARVEENDPRPVVVEAAPRAGKVISSQPQRQDVTVSLLISILRSWFAPAGPV
jgi:hypothetical protein